MKSGRWIRTFFSFWRCWVGLTACNTIPPRVEPTKHGLLLASNRLPSDEKGCMLYAMSNIVNEPLTLCASGLRRVLREDSLDYMRRTTGVSRDRFRYQLQGTKLTKKIARQFFFLCMPPG